MYEELHITTLEKGGYTVQSSSRVTGAYHPFLVAVSTKSELLTWLATNLADRPPDLTGEKPAPKLESVDDEIPF